MTDLDRLDMDAIRARHIEPHDCPREGPWSACDFNRTVPRLVSAALATGQSGSVDETWAWLALHEHHTVHFARDNGGVDSIRCASCEASGTGRARLYCAAPARLAATEEAEVKE